MKKKIYQTLTILLSVAAILCGILTVALADEAPGVSISAHALELEKPSLSTTPWNTLASRRQKKTSECSFGRNSRRSQRWIPRTR